jgi:hypothetical protein
LRTVEHACQARIWLWFFCVGCGNAKRFDPRDVLIMFRADDLELAALARRLKCSRCGARRGRIIPDDRPMASWPRR